MKAVRFDEYGGVDVLEVREVEDPHPDPGRVVVAVKARASQSRRDLDPRGIPARSIPRDVSVR